MKTLKRTINAFLMGFCMALMVLGSSSAYAVHDLNEFELDRDALDSNGAATSPDDWDTVNLPYPGPGAGGHSFEHTGVITDPTPEGSIFTSGKSKDIHDVSEWKWKQSSNILDKNNITNAYAAAYNVAGDLVIYFGLDRLSNNGSAQVGFWFFKNNITLDGDGTSGGGDHFIGTHANGDILVQSNFSKGGDVDSVTVYEWQSGSLVMIASGGDCIGLAAGDNVCATVNQGNPDAVAPWPYTPKSGTDGYFPQGSFFEGGINLSGLGLTDACFSSFMAETRSSTPFDAVLKDFVGPREFETCSIEVTKTCTNARLNVAQDMIIYDIKGSVTAQGFGGDLYNVALSDVPAADGDFIEVDCATFLVPTGDVFPLDSLDGTTCYANTMTVDLIQNGLSDTVTVTANTKSDDTGTVLTDTDTAVCPNLNISPSIEVSKDCDAEVEVKDNLVVARVDIGGKVCNTGDTNLSNVVVQDLAITTDPDPLVNGVVLSAPADPGNPTVAEGACVEYDGSYYPSAALENDGTTATDNAGEVVFKDTVRADAVDIFGNSITPHTDMADCPLCDGETD